MINMINIYMSKTHHLWIIESLSKGSYWFFTSFYMFLLGKGPGRQRESIGFPRLAARQSPFARDRESRCREARAEAICLGAHGGTETRKATHSEQFMWDIGLSWFVLSWFVLRVCKYMVIPCNTLRTSFKVVNDEKSLDP
jgi:hypothetical protein